MIKINLEKELLAQNRKVATPKELLIIKELDKVGTIEGNALERIGIKTYQQGARVKHKIDSQKIETETFNQDRVFHISQIEKICNKYYLKFLPSCLYNGSIDKELPYKISNFEAAYDVKCHSSSEQGFMSTRYVGNTFIIAPKESFILQEKPLDPLLFYKINDSYYYLIHKWGNDLNITNRIKSIMSGLPMFLLTVVSLGVSVGFFISPSASLVIFIAAAIMGPIRGVAFDESPNNAWTFYPKNIYNSPFIEE
jgi:hypothetical protein